ncbi:branched-chain amino acid ABC transporter permease [Microbacterium sp.]|uniref:branched-chain amino acid ABC transporter permease n=1 Tax=Microbacterium sp. TaxID=51671 RepID=UPI0039E4C18C
MNWFVANEILLQQAAVSAVLAGSVQMLLKAGIFSFLPVGTWMIGGYAAAILSFQGWPTVLAIIAAVLIGAVVSFIVAFAMRRLSGMVLGMASLAFVLIVQVLVRTGPTEVTGGALGLYGIPPQLNTIAVVLIAAAVAVLLWWHERGRAGRAVESIREDAHVASAVGIPVRGVQAWLVTVAGALGALSGACYAFMFNAITPDMGGFKLVVATLSMVIIGGVASWKGAYIGTALMTLLPSLVAIFDAWSLAAYGVILVAVVVLAPGGLLGIWRDIRSRIRARSQANANSKEAVS